MMVVKPMNTSRTGVVTVIAVVSGLAVALALAPGTAAQTAPPKAPVADEPVTVKGAFDADDGVARPTKPETPQQVELKKK